MLDRVPVEVTGCPQWLLWKPIWLEQQKRWSKVPYQANGHQASVQNPAHWASFSSCKDVFAQHGEAAKLGGLGFVFGHASGLSGLDADKVLNAETGAVIDFTALEIARKFDSYTEVSPSRTGLHTLFLGEVPDGRRFRNIELYGQGRYFTVTGIPYFDVPIANRQTIADALRADIDASRAKASFVNVDWSVQPDKEHDALWRMACGADNGTKFQDLWNDRWQAYYGSHSEADIALVNILAYYSNSPSQVMYMFSCSPCCANATDDKYRKRPTLLQSMVAKAFDQKPPLVAIPAIPVKVTTQPQSVAADDDDTEDTAAKASDPFTLPPGAMGAIAQFVYNQAPYPMREAAIAAAITLMAGICGRQYQFQGTGLNLYTMLLANTGAGKEAMSTGLGKLMDAICNPSSDPNASKTDIGYPAARSFRGPAQFTGKGLHKTLEKCVPLSFFSVGNEFADTMRSMADPKSGNQGTIDLKRALLDMYSKASEGNAFAGQVTADKDTSIGTLNSPAFTMLVESTPAKLYSYLTPDLIKEGLLSRMLVIQFDGFGEYNEHHHEVKVDGYLRDWLRALCDNVFVLKREMDKRIEVKATDAAIARIKHYRVYARERLKSDDETTRDLWNRAALATNRIAALVAIGCHPTLPTIQVEHVDWAWNIVSRQVVLLSGKFRRGETGEQGVDERAQLDGVLAACKRFMSYDPANMPKQAARQAFIDARMAGVIPFAFLSQQTASLAAFRHAIVRHSQALRTTLDIMQSSGMIKRVTLDRNDGVYFQLT